MILRHSISVNRRFCHHEKTFHSLSVHADPVYRDSLGGNGRRYLLRYAGTLGGKLYLSDRRRRPDPRLSRRNFPTRPDDHPSGIRYDLSSGKRRNHHRPERHCGIPRCQSRSLGKKLYSLGQKKQRTQRLRGQLFPSGSKDLPSGDGIGSVSVHYRISPSDHSEHTAGNRFYG